jgi:hypothetical protein
MRAIVVLLLILTQWQTSAELDKDQQEGLKQTQDLLNNPAERQKAVDADPHAKDVDNKVNALAGSKENKDEIYGIASEVFQKVAAESNGDPAKMQKLLEEAQKNPQAFYDKYFNDADKARVRGVANKIQSDKPSLNNKK